MQIFELMKKLLRILFMKTLDQQLAKNEMTGETFTKDDLLWDTPSNARHSSRVIMDKFGLSWGEKDLLCAVISAESGFNVKAINFNRNGSVDYGIVQMNSTYWVGKGKYFSSPEEVYEFPEKSIIFMIESYKKGHLNWWYGYTNKSYLKFMPKVGANIITMNTQNIKSKLFSLTTNDVVKGLVMAVLGAVLTAVYEGLQIGAIDWHTVMMTSAITGVGYLLKNFFSDQEGKFGGII